MNGPPSLLDIFEVQARPPEELKKAEDDLRNVTTKLGEDGSAGKAAEEYLQVLGNRQAELSTEIAKDEATLQPKFMSNMLETVRNPACDILALSEQLRPLEYKLAFSKHSKDLLVHVLIPAAILHKFGCTLRLRKTEREEANLLAFISHERAMQKAALLFAEEGRAAIVGERTQALRKYALEAERRVVQAEEELREERKRQLIVEQQRYACHQVTRAEAVAAIPACAALIA